tara:strand:- start:1971 stop:3200 length:1230 start_codon:yes stop_codon:yes gene_type:complete
VTDVKKYGSSSLRIAIVTESYAPLNTSAAVQLAELSVALRNQGHVPVVIVPTDPSPNTPAVQRVQIEGTTVFRLAMPFSKKQGYARRLAYETLMPFCMIRHWRKAIANTEKLDGVVWYSPSIFHGIFTHYLKRRHKIRGYLILRDIFPDWAVDLGIMKQYNPAYWFFKAVEHIQYRTADVIGVQTPGNLPHIQKWARSGGRRVEVLHNWYKPKDTTHCSINIRNSSLSERKIFIYAGNIGIAQNMKLFVELANRMQHRKDLGFVFVGRGTHFANIAAAAQNLDNVLCFDEINSDEIPGLYRQCHYGIVSLHPHHMTHNIPGKFISYMGHGLPVLAAVNQGNDLIDLITQYGVGLATDTTSVTKLEAMATELANSKETPVEWARRCTMLSQSLFRPNAAAEQIVSTFVQP